MPTGPVATVIAVHRDRKGIVHRVAKVAAHHAVREDRLVVKVCRPAAKDHGHRTDGRLRRSNADRLPWRLSKSASSPKKKASPR